ncbi:T20D4.11-like domain-containing protein [Caenorhabditis elegans]|uniref:T20D4.11-like domain-containing protein n=1 Tax=Caenorhabditis elegans TaxID=6239 RepID=P91463_CAEEL|nr:DUF19 domain-containing protein [Caenorhabditis elegans]CCD62941.1 DUF19 domain-containing protein [Caenorhabditis elegans]|eukprot:NP_503949.2 Uncharacterized protein CELE_T20D4.12 [Caenorhabditis elegans]
MIGFLKLVVIGTVFLEVANAAFAEEEILVCTEEESLRSLFCAMRIPPFINKTELLDMNDKKEVKELKEECHNVLSCFNKIKCLGKNGDQIPKLRVVGKYCKALDYVHDNFAECSDKLNAKKSTCFDDWDPIPNKVHFEKDPIKKEQLRSEACKIYFGKDDCMMKEIKATCGQQEWDAFRVHFINIAGGFVDTCDFSRLN